MRSLDIGKRTVGDDAPVFIIAEMSANHGRDFGQAVEIVRAAHAAGADAVKLQTYTPDTMTLKCDSDLFRIHGTAWDGRTLHDLYAEAYTPWEWQPKLKEVADDLGILLFSSPFDFTAVDFLEEMDVPCYKIASFELVDLPLIRRVAATGKPVIMSTGMASEAEIAEGVEAFRDEGGRELVLLKCTSAYPALPEEMNLRTIPYLAEKFGVVAGLSDHSLGTAVPVAAVALGAGVIEKHLCLSRSLGGPDAGFSLEPDEFKSMVDAVRIAEKALGSIDFRLSEKQKEAALLRRSLFIVKPVGKGEPLTLENVRAIRPGHGLHTRELENVLGKTARSDLKEGTPLAWDMIE